MKKTVSIILGLLLAMGLALAAYMLRSSVAPIPASGSGPADHFDQSAAIEDRIRALEVAVAEERNARRESELRMDALQAQFDARRSGEPFNFFETRMHPDLALRDEIGDVEYEQYLEANSRPTSVTIGSVLESSPGQRAGLQSGDEIVRYDGQRVFSTQELNQQTMLGEAGESVVVDVMRDGVLMQVVLPRGPIGVTTGRRFGRR